MSPADEELKNNNIKTIHEYWKEVVADDLPILTQSSKKRKTDVSDTDRKESKRLKDEK